MKPGPNSDSKSLQQSLKLPSTDPRSKLSSKLPKIEKKSGDVYKFMSSMMGSPARDKKVAQGAEKIENITFMTET